MFFKKGDLIRLTPTIAAGSLVILFFAQAALLVSLRHNATTMVVAWQASSGLLQLVAAGFAMLRLRSSKHLRAHWGLLAIFGVLCVFGDSFDIIARYFLHRVPSLYTCSGRDLLNLSALIPLFLLISMPAGRQYFQSFLWVDAFQAVLITCIFYALIFHSLPFVRMPDDGAGASLVVRLLEAGGGFVAIGGFLHYIAAIDTNERRFYRLIAITLALATASLMLNDEISLHDPNEIWTNIIAYLQATLAIWLIYNLPAELDRAPSAGESGLLADTINIGSPVISSAALLALGLAVQHREPAMGLAAVIIAFSAFAVRFTVYLRSFEQAQRALERVRRRLETLSYTDELTGVANRRAFDQALNIEWRRAARSRAALSLIFIDVDYFKELNDKQGHQVGDDCLVKIAEALQCAMPRSTDLIGRYGGDEFAAVLPMTDKAAAETVAARLVNAVNGLALFHPTAPTGCVTISLGIGVCGSTDGAEAARLLEVADSALYEAKAAGRNAWRSQSLRHPPFPALNLAAKAVTE